MSLDPDILHGLCVTQMRVLIVYLIVSCFSKDLTVVLADLASCTRASLGERMYVWHEWQC